MALEGKLVRLREERLEDQPHLVALRNDLATQAWSQALPPDYTLPMYRGRFEARKFSFRRTDGRFIIEVKEGNHFAGYIAYTGLRPRWEATIGLIVDKAWWGKGVSDEAQELLLRFLFVELGLRVVRLWTQSGNAHALAAAQRQGFRLSVRQREAVIFHGRTYDNLGCDLLRHEYFALHPELTDKLPTYQGEA